jgi:PleD family two-component response regulator
MDKINRLTDPLKVLVIGEPRDVAQLAYNKSALAHGHYLTFFANIHEALRYLIRNDVDAIVIEAFMPNGNIFEMLQIVKQLPEKCQPVVVVAAIEPGPCGLSLVEGVREAVLLMGADDFIMISVQTQNAFDTMNNSVTDLVEKKRSKDKGFL